MCKIKKNITIGLYFFIWIYIIICYLGCSSLSTNNKDKISTASISDTKEPLSLSVRDSLARIKNGYGEEDKDWIEICNNWLKVGMKKDLILNSLGPPIWIEYKTKEGNAYYYWGRQGINLCIEFCREEVIHFYMFVSSDVKIRNSGDAIPNSKK